MVFSSSCLRKRARYDQSKVSYKITRNTGLNRNGSVPVQIRKALSMQRKSLSSFLPKARDLFTMFLCMLIYAMDKIGQAGIFTIPGYCSSSLNFLIGDLHQ